MSQDLEKLQKQYALDSEHSGQPWQYWEVCHPTRGWESCTTAPSWGKFEFYRRKSNAPDFTSEEFQLKPDHSVVDLCRKVMVHAIFESSRCSDMTVGDLKEWLGQVFQDDVVEQALKDLKERVE